jgi:hypothetical protein
MVANPTITFATWFNGYVKIFLHFRNIAYFNTYFPATALLVEIAMSRGDHGSPNGLVSNVTQASSGLSLGTNLAATALISHVYW